ncbi:cytochrome c [Polaribacter sp. WD7]|uniref:cytochrome c n=1 Tax=Polaribacter sp. WD7 TaxID=2269061 RepID=UPI000DF41A0A|nr:cytochrome c [Polaribacter sp. WD7]RCS28168.1 cytochrome c [Polaribacter sp. WD7]
MKNSVQIKKHFFLLFVGFVFASCLTNVDEEVVINDDPAIEDPCSTITYTLNVRPILDNNCTTCHSTNGGQPPNLETFENASANAIIIRSEVVRRTMPIGGSLTDEEIQAISCWVEAGALNN